jgi:hypothetical protein
MWDCTDQADGVHVVPRYDLLMHEPDNCACLPILTPVPRLDGSYGWMTTHNAWDNRE